VNHRYLIFYKPFDVLTQFSQPSDSARLQLGRESDVESVSDRPKTLKEFISVPQVYPVGRLDRDSEGLLLLTDHGQLQHRLSDPQFHHPRTYWVQVEGAPTEADLDPLRHGVEIRIQKKRYTTRPATARLLTQEPPLPPRQPPIRFRKSVPTQWLEITLTEGRNRQVRRMTAAIGFPTLRLVRVAIAHLQLDTLQPGEWRDLSPEEIARLLKTAFGNSGRSPLISQNRKS
jgi:23S rRNA pseudouridine2457 synthase